MEKNYVVFFDLDETIWGHVPYEIQSISMAKYLNIPYTKEFTEQVLNFEHGNYLDDMIVTKEAVAIAAEENIPYLKQYGITGKQFWESKRYTDKVYLKDGAIELLQYLKQGGYSIFAYTDQFLDDQMSILEKFDCAKYFEGIYSWDGTYAKPNEDRIKSVVLNHPNKKYIYIGDSLNKDMISASYIDNCTSIWYNKSNENGDIKVDYCTNDLKSIIPFIANMD